VAVPDLSPFQIVGFSAVALVVIGWLVVSFSKPGAARARAAWLSATALYVALGTLFTSLFVRARQGGSLAGTIVFGFLMAVFAAGLVLAAVRSVASFAARPTKGDHATH
jgi:glucose uptake protein GlcU